MPPWRMQGRLLVTAMCAVGLAGCADQIATQPASSSAPRATGPTAVASLDRAKHPIGAVYVSTNATSGNAVVAFARDEDGSLSKIGEFATGGNGIGGGVDPLQSQGSVVLGDGHQQLFVVNAGSNSVSAFDIGDDESLHLAGTVSSRGNEPISLVAVGRRLYVLDADNTVAGYWTDRGAAPRAIDAASLTLGPASDGPSTINASRDGRFLFVTQRDGNAIDVIRVDQDGSLSRLERTPSSGGGPFGFAVTPRNQLLVSEASGDAPNGAVSSYHAEPDGALREISKSLSTHQAATCWLVVTNDGRFTYVANAGSGSISGYAVSPNGALTPLSTDGRTAVANTAGATPLDMDLSRDGKFLYVLETGAGAVGAFAVRPDGRLVNLPDTPGLTAASGLQGLASF